MKTRVLFILFFLAIQSSVFAQKNKAAATPAKPVDFTIPLTPEKWAFQAEKVDFVDYKGQKSMKIAAQSGQVVLKDLVFKDGTIEFDVEPILPEFAQSIYFHRKDEKEQEIVYLRVGTIGNKLTNNAIQYTPYFDAINMWDMYPQYQGPALIKGGDWNHIKLVISGLQMRVYMNHLPQPVLEIPKLEGNMKEGSIAFDGASYIANLQIKPDATEGLTPQEGVDLSNHEANYLRKWAVSTPTDLPPGSEAFLGNQPKADQFVDSIKAERAGFINLTRKFGGNKSRKVVWLKTKITAKENVKTRLQLGFSDEVWVFLNKQTVFVDKNLFQQAAMRKYPEGRMSKDNASFDINLKAGENELLIAVANDFYGWGIIARLESTDGISGLDEVGTVLKLAKELASLDVTPYLGVYTNPEVNFKLSFSQKDKNLMAKAAGNDEFAMQAMGNHTFRLDQFGVVIEFKPGEKKLLLRDGGGVKEFVRE